MFGSAVRKNWIDWSYGIIAFLASFLLFQIQPISGKLITPMFGGSAAVWTTCMLFFQASLILGYMLAHTICGLPPRRQPLVLLLLLIVSCVATLIPIDANALGNSAPTLNVLKVLAISIGPIFILNSATAPILQSWYFTATRMQPYRLYAISNVGSFFGLLSYPFVVEPFLELRYQMVFWFVGFGLLSLGFLILSTTLVNGSTPKPLSSSDSRAGPHQQVNWIAILVLAAIPSALFLATTNVVSATIAPTPLIWIAPLSIYLITFVLAFAKNLFQDSILLLTVSIASVVVVGWVIHLSPVPVPALLLSLYFSLFCCCLLCHCQLAKYRPHPELLTRFYLAVSTGGVVGGLFVAILAPTFFSETYEFALTFGLAIAFPLLSMEPLKRLTSSEQSNSFSVAIALSATLFLAAVAWLDLDLLRRVSKLFDGSRLQADRIRGELSGTIPLIAFCAALMLALALRVAGRIGRAFQFVNNGISFLVALIACAAVANLAHQSFGVWRTAGNAVGTVARAPTFYWLLGAVLSALLASPKAQAQARWALLWPLVNALLFGAAVTKILLVSFRYAAISLPLILLLTIAPLIVTRLLKKPEERATDSGNLHFWIASALFLGVSIAPNLESTVSKSLGLGTYSGLVVWVPLALSCVIAQCGQWISRRQASKESFQPWHLLTAGLFGAAFVVTNAVGSREDAILYFGCGLMCCLSIFAGLGFSRSQFARQSFMIAMPCMLVGLGIGTIELPPGKIEICSGRNFFGTYKVIESKERDRQILLHGSVVHGEQFLDAPAEPTTYYDRKSGIGQLLSKSRPSNKSVAIVGLGVGTLATYGKPGEKYRFYEIDAEVADIAERYFTFLDRSHADISVRICDGRIGLQESDLKFDVIAIDAFSGGSIPTHLLTREAIEIYLERTAPEGCIAFHLSNSHLDLTPVINHHAKSFGLNLAYVDDLPNSLWAIMSYSELPEFESFATGHVSSRQIEWTDNHHSLLSIIRWR